MRREGGHTGEVRKEESGAVGGPRTFATKVEGADGTVLNVVGWPVEQEVGRVLVIHGLGEHVGRYQPLAEALTARGYSVLLYDQRGHGLSQGRRGHVDDFGLFVEDLAVVREQLDSLLPGSGLPFFYGHSMGGLVLIRFLQTRTLETAGAVLSAPWLGTLVRVPAWKETLARVLRRTAPWVGVPSGVDPTRLTRDPERQASYLSDPLINQSLTVALWDAVTRAQKSALSEGIPELPVLLLLPGDDPVADGALARQWASSAGGIQLLDLPGFRHEPHNELGRGEVFEKVADWLDVHGAEATVERSAS